VKIKDKRKKKKKPACATLEVSKPSMPLRERSC